MGYVLTETEDRLFFKKRRKKKKQKHAEQRSVYAHNSTTVCVHSFILSNIIAHCVVQYTYLLYPNVLVLTLSWDIQLKVRPGD